ncbi:MAG TPA: ShlB/FhaC/HecB family hemolysin secretion/activation protein [Herbaspirillum sp.]|jgi:hemolysin activation/secretion protein
MPLNRQSSFLFGILALAALPSLAQRPPTAGQLLQQVEPPPSLPSADVPPTVVEERAVAPAADGTRFRLEGVRLSGNRVYTEEELLPMVQDDIGKTLSLDQLDALARRITDYYRARGYLVARAYLPPQEIKDGIVTIAVLEGRLGEIILNNSSGLAGNAIAPVHRIRPGDAVNNLEFEGALLRLADIPGVEVKSTLRPGASVGTSDFLVDVAPGPALTGSFDADNFGNRYTAAARVGASVFWNNPTGLGDQVSLRAQTGGSNFSYGRIGYQLPVGSSATRVGVAWSRMDYKLGEDFSSLEAGGDATVGSIYLQHPLLRSRERSWFATLQFDQKRLRDYIGVVESQTEKRVNLWSIGTSANFIDGLGGGGSNSASLTYSRGQLGLDALSDLIDSFTARSQGAFGKWALSYQRLQRLPGQFLLSLSANGQRANKNLDSSEKMLLGGATGVRAYPQGEASGDNGYLVNLELRYPLGQSWDAIGFYDRGRVTVNHSPWLNASDNGRDLAGYGVGASYSAARFALRVFAAWKAGTGAPESDVDRTPRIWMQGSSQF